MNNKLRLLAMLLVAGAIGTSAPRADAGPEKADVVIEWNQLLQANIPSTAGLLTPRHYATLHVAIFDAVNSIHRSYAPYWARVPGAYGASAEAAAAQAGRDVLVALIPDAQATFDAALAARLANIEPSSAALGVAAGRKAAQQILEWRANDGSGTAAPTYELPNLPGLWQPTPPQSLHASFPQFRDVEPFALLTSTQYLPKPPPTLTSDEYTQDFDEVKRLGSATSTERTADQTLLARLFAPNGYSTQHWAVWNNVARDASQSERWSLVKTARLFALMNVSIHDGLQTSHTSKFIYGLWRPITAIRRADEDLNPVTVADVAWTPLITTPPYPSHSSNQTCVGSSAARALARAFGSDAMQFEVTWRGASGNADVTRSYTGFWQLAVDQARSRVYAGIHYTFELTASQVSCIQVADYVVENYMRPRHRYFD